MADQIELQGPPLDTPSFLQFSPADSNLLLAGSWDATTRIYDVNTRTERSKVDHRAAVLAGCWSRDGARAYVGGLEAQVREINVGTSEDRVLGVHDKTVSAAMWASEQNALITGSWDCTLRVWDPRAANTLVNTIQLPERVYRADLVQNTLVCALGSRLFTIFDTRNLSAGPQQRESQLKYLTRSVAVMANGAGFAVGSVEGRVAVEYVDSSPAAAEKKYAFKCHRAAVGDVDHVWSVNALAFHPIYNTFASGGSDGTVSIWDHNSKKRLKQIPKAASGAGVATLAFSPDGAKLALGLGYTWDEGEAGAAQSGPPSIQVYSVGDEVKPKGWTGA